MAAHCGIPLLAAAGSFGHGIDVACVILLAFCAVQGGLHGLTGEAARVAGLLAALFALYGASGFWGASALRWLPGEAQSIGRGLIVVVGLVATATLAGQTVRWGVDRFLRLLLDQPANAVFGVVAGGLRAAMILTGIFLVLSFVVFGEAGRVLFEDSLAGRAALPVVLRLRSQLSRLDPAWALHAGR